MKVPPGEARRLEAMALQNGGTVRRTRLEAPKVILPPLDPEIAPRGSYVLVMRDWLPLLINDMLHGKRREWMRRHKILREEVAAEAHRQKIPRATSARRVQLHIEFPAGRNTPDPDALSKSLFDALKWCGLILDDNYANLEALPPVYYRGPSLRTEVHLTDIACKEILVRDHRE